MYRSVFLSLALAAPVLAQRDEEVPPVPPVLATREPVLPLPRIYSLVSEMRTFGPRVDVGLVIPRAPDESEIDMEAVLRAFLPDEETIRRDEERLRPTIYRMQGMWRLERMNLDGVEVPAAAFSGTKYLVQGRVIAQSETSEVWDRPWPATPVRIEQAPVLLPEPEEPGFRRVYTPPPIDLMPQGPAGVSKPAGATLREDARQEEEVRMNMVYLREGRIRVFWWNRYGSTADPHLSRDRPSLRVALPIRGNLDVGDNTLTLQVRGFGLRSLLPIRFQQPFYPLAPAGRETETPLEPERRVTLVMVRDEVMAESVRKNRVNIIPTLKRVPMEWEP
jgi:hypothetical protein